MPLFEVLHAADRAACAAMRLVVHETYARNVYLDARDLEPEDFKTKPEGHTGGALNMVPAYVGYMAANAITGFTRSWIMGQGHTVAAIDSVNLLLGNMTEAHAERYSVSDEGLTRYVRDFYSYKLKPDGTQDSPLGSHVNARTDVEAAHHFNESARRLWVPPEKLEEAPAKLQRHEVSGRPREKDHPLARRNVRLEESPAPGYLPVPEDRTAVAGWIRSSSMRAADAAFLAIVQANPHLRPRVGNPDEMKSNRMTQTLEALEFWVTDPEATIPEGTHGAVITALNEEAVASAALANKGGINIIVTYEAFGAKMHGEVRQEIVFANHEKEAGKPPRRLSVPLVLTSHTWENAKNEQSHQDPAMAEAMLGEPSDVSRVLFPADHNSATAVVHGAYETQGQIWTLVVPKGDVPRLFTPEESERLLSDGALRLEWSGHDTHAHPWRHLATIAHGMLRMTRRNDVLADRLDAVETLGATGVIRTYKTGTLTKRRMTVSRVALDEADIGSESFAHKAGHEPPGDLPAVETTSGKHRDAVETRQRVRQRRCSSNG